MANTILPAIRSHVGDWNFYSTTLSFKEVRDLIKSHTEIHESENLSDWIQREAIDKHTKDISNYIQENEQRFLGSLIVGVYDGDPQWSPLNVSFRHDHLHTTDEQKEKLEGKLGFLAFSGEEKLFAIDGQHRVAGIKKALENEELYNEICDNEVAALFVSHVETPTGKQRTRRLFTTVNKKAKKVNDAAIIALDEDNGFAIITRRLIENHWLFEDKREHLSYSGSAPINENNETHLTSIIALYNLIMELYPLTNKAKFKNERPTEDELNTHFNLCKDFFDCLLDNVEEYQDVFINSNSTANLHRNHLLFRPAGQKVFARATKVLLTRGKTLNEAVDLLLTAELDLTNVVWHFILWNPITNTIENENKKVAIAETRLLNLVGEAAKSTTNQRNLDELLDNIPQSQE